MSGVGLIDGFEDDIRTIREALNRPSRLPDSGAARHAIERIVQHVRVMRVNLRERNERAATKPIPIRLQCPMCGELHVDKGKFATLPHHTHSCQGCGHTWRPAVVHTVGVQFLPGFRDEEEPAAPTVTVTATPRVAGIQLDACYCENPMNPCWPGSCPNVPKAPDLGWAPWRSGAIAGHVRVTLSCENCQNFSNDALQSVDGARLAHYIEHHSKCVDPDPRSDFQKRNNLNTDGTVRRERGWHQPQNPGDPAKVEPAQASPILAAAGDWGVWCRRDGSTGFWRQADVGADPLRTTFTDAVRRAKNLTDDQKTRTDSIGWVYTAQKFPEHA